MLRKSFLVLRIFGSNLLKLVNNIVFTQLEYFAAYWHIARRLCSGKYLKEDFLRGNLGKLGNLSRKSEDCEFSLGRIFEVRKKKCLGRIKDVRKEPCIGKSLTTIAHTHLHTVDVHLILDCLGATHFIWIQFTVSIITALITTFSTIYSSQP